MGKKSKDKKTHKHKHKHSRRDTLHIERNEQTKNEQSRPEQPRTKLRLSYRRTDGDDNPRVSNSSVNDDNVEAQNVNNEYQSNEHVEDSSTSRAEEPPRRTILRLKFNPDPPSKKSKKRKHKHKRRTEVVEVASSYSHGKVDKGKRKMRDLVEESESIVDPGDKEDSVSSIHSRKKVKRQNISNNESVNNNNTQLSLNEKSRPDNKVVVGDSADNVEMRLSSDINVTTEYLTTSSKRKLKEVQDNVNTESNEIGKKLPVQGSVDQEQRSSEGTKKVNKVAGKKPLENIEAGSSITVQDRKEASAVTSTYQLREKRSYPPSFKDSNKADDPRPSKVHKVSSKAVQSVQESAAVISSKSSEIRVPLQQTTKVDTKDFDNNETLDDKSTIKDVVVSSAPKTGPVRKLGRPPKSQETQRTNTQRSWTWQKKKKDLKTILNKLVDSFERKDAYGFFLEPVDTNIVTDYLTIITNPMDLGAMRRKVERNEYTNIDSFKEDLALICNNCKTYNAPETLYYKSAEKLWAFGEKATERERDSILLEEEKAKALKGIVYVDEMGKKPIANYAVSSRGSSVSRPVRQPRRTRRGDPRKQFALDGSVLPSGNPEDLLPKARPFGETPLLTVISSKAQRPARFEDYGPFATLGMDAPYYSSSEKEYFYNIYGDERGYAYAQSMKNFVKDMGDEMNLHVDNFLNKLTRGAHNIDKCVAEMISEVGSVNTFTILDTELGPVDVEQEINRIQRLPELRKQSDELEMWQNEKIDLDALTNDKGTGSTLTDPGNASFQDILDFNAKSLARLIADNNNDDPQGSQKQLDDVQHRLFQLAQHAPEDEIKSMPSMQTYVMPPVSTAATKTLLPKHTMSGVEQNDPISALVPSLPEFSTTNIKGRTKPCNYNPAGKCANCQTTDTPGWRAGETPDQKLCNACGLYYAKNKSHRPPNLWVTSSR